MGELPSGLSTFFDPFLRHEVKEALEAGGEAYLSRNDEGINGLFIYDNYEVTGTIFTHSRPAFDAFFMLKPSSYIFSELDASEIPRENWNVWKLDLTRIDRLSHRFKHHVSIDRDAAELDHFMAANQPETNRQWISVALRNGDKCFVVRVGNRIVGIAWMTIVDGYARSHGVYVEPQFRRMGITRDNLLARIIYLKSRNVHTLVNEIAESNAASSAHASNAGEKVVGRIYLYATPDAPASDAARSVS